jgi:hypothetical protein
MAKKIVHKKTPITRKEMVDATYLAWCRYFGSHPSKDTLRVLLAQWAHETGEGKAMHNYNVGNVKSREGDGHDYTYFACWEILSKERAEKMQKEDPNRVKIVRYEPNDKCRVWFYPEHPGCRFRAFETLEEGLVDHLAILSNHSAFKKAWPAVRTGDPRLFAKLLKEARYYTASYEAYVKALLWWFDVYKNIVVPTPPILHKEEQDKIKAMVAFSLKNLSSVDRGEE